MNSRRTLKNKVLAWTGFDGSVVGRQSLVVGDPGKRFNDRQPVTVSIWEHTRVRELT